MSDFNTNDFTPEPSIPSSPTPVVPNKKGFDIASLILGITAIVPGCCCTYIGILLGILAVVFSVLFTKANPGSDVKKGMAKAGLILGIIGIVLCTILLIVGLIFASSNWYEEILNQYNVY
jgi:hypothetical protein